LYTIKPSQKDFTITKRSFSSEGQEITKQKSELKLTDLKSYLKANETNSHFDTDSFNFKIPIKIKIALLEYLKDSKTLALLSSKTIETKPKLRKTKPKEIKENINPDIPVIKNTHLAIKATKYHQPKTIDILPMVFFENVQ